ncbi:molecular chaperone [Phytobacter diazotrophicus]|uniref:fimbrial biogenesis chaperone n=1 Tax=Phytobacter TaxID=447792 RepID=UPI00232BC6DC|nr:molecular chaperone [Phytobacter diazotrophicus]MDC0727558.1 molecular chaperone [Phytobacter diazotrophicus]MDC0734908.1 molecular chaperone [Phytobacter diazotrophicus]
MSVTSGAARAAGLMMMLCTAMGDANAAATILLWPIDPWLGSENKATELWIQNQGNTPATMQVRIVRWRQERGDERYQPQTDVVASPPIVTIQKGTKQLIRLIKQTEIPAGTEQAYRIIVDEIPPAGSSQGQMGIKLQMRYSIPLFVYGKGITTYPESANHALVDPRELSWQVVRENGKPALQIRNQGDVHVRLTAVSARQGGQTRVIADGLLGYVLPGETRSWPLPAGLPAPVELKATINARESEWQSPAR